jgi:hypothetical protein
MAKIHTIGEMGDIGAKPGSREWAIAARRKLHSAIHNTESMVKGVKLWIDVFDEFCGYKQLEKPDGSKFKSFSEFCSTPEPHGLGYPEEVVNRIRAEKDDARIADVIGTHGGDRRSEAAKQGDNITLKERGTSTAYIKARLKRDAPEIAAKLASGEIKSARAAGIAAGIVKVKTPVEKAASEFKKCEDKLSAAKVLLKECTTKELSAIIRYAEKLLQKV